MHPARRTAVLGLVLLLPLAGCLGAAGPAAPDADADPVVVTRPDDFSYLDQAGGRGDVAHLHDYWGGNTRLTVIELSLIHI